MDGMESRISVLEAQMKQLVGNGQPGTIEKLHDRISGLRDGVARDIKEVRDDVSTDLKEFRSDAQKMWKYIILLLVVVALSNFASGGGAFSLKQLLEMLPH